jgi:hypothetical protein
MKKAARVTSYIFHPLLMPTLGMWMIFHSGTYLALLDEEAQRAILFVLALGTLIFPLLMMPVLYYRNLLRSLQDRSREARTVLLMVVLVLYVITFAYFVRLPLSRVLHAYVLSGAVVLLCLFILGFWFHLCTHSAALGGLTAMLFCLILLFETPLEGMLMAVLFASGVTGSARIYTGLQRPWEVYAGFALGFGVVGGTILLF